MRFQMQLFFALILCYNYIGTDAGNLFCYFNSLSLNRNAGEPSYTLRELDLALNFCDYLVYGYATIDESSYELEPPTPQLQFTLNHYRTLGALRQRHTHLRVLLSVGADRDLTPGYALEGRKAAEANKYLKLLEEPHRRSTFVRSALQVLSDYDFDGLDVAWQFPKYPPVKPGNFLTRKLHAIADWFSSANVIDARAQAHKQQFEQLIMELRDGLRGYGKLLSYTHLPHTPTSLYINIANLTRYVDFVNLAAFDFQTPLRDPKMADHPAPLYALYERNPTHNVDYQVGVWLNETLPAHRDKLNLGIPAYGQAWTMSKKSGLTGYPPLTHTHGVAPAGNRTQLAGLLSYPEICAMLHGDKQLSGAAATLHKVGDPMRRYGFYAYRRADDEDRYGVWVGYEDPIMAAAKTHYASAEGLGGVALFDVSLDDAHGQCMGEKYPILRSIKYELSLVPERKDIK